MNILVLGANGGVGRHVVELGREHGHRMSGLVRTAPAGDAGFESFVGDVQDEAVLDRALVAQDAVVFAVGVNHIGKTTLFSDSTRKLLPLVRKHGVERLVCITGIGAGETKGHGGFFYDRVIFPLFTKNRYADKDVQEEIVRQSGLRWTIVRPAPFSEKQSSSELVVTTDVRGVVLRTITRREVAEFVLRVLEEGSFVGETPFIGHVR